MVWLERDCEKKDNDLLCAVIAIVTSESKSEHNRNHSYHPQTIDAREGCIGGEHMGDDHTDM